MSRLSDDDLPATREDVRALKAEMQKEFEYLRAEMRQTVREQRLELEQKLWLVFIVGGVSLIQVIIYYAVITYATTKH